MTLKQILSASLLTTSAAIASPGPTFGIASMDGDGHLTVVSASPLDLASTLQLQFPDSRSRSKCCKQLSASDLRLAEDKVNASNPLSGQPAYIYQAKVPAHWAEMPFIGVAVFGKVRAVTSTADRLVVADAAGLRFAADLCVSREGVHLTERRGKRLHVHLYFWLGYEVESPTCRPMPSDGQ
ncbi:hypothetical protein [Roseateles amylovorans]|uniref:Uncharacterized protein n=1 Tax=Roseateles amylovorans TaxID=2978473 RepID=A0ABY6AUR7_9BURK|nr:hypothetical protein [Roseateles amylovorans]UXH76048.1 hypothetical protein N4261_13275 [Roseateles amylovorans]